MGKSPRWSEEIPTIFFKKEGERENGEGELPMYGNLLIIVFILSLHNKSWYFIIKLYSLNPITLFIIFIIIFRLINV